MGGHAQRRRRSRAGFTLVEVMVATLLLAMGLAAVLTGITQAMAAAYMSAQKMAAYGLCADMFEQMRAADYNSLIASNYPAQQVQITHLGGTAMVPLPGTRQVAIADATQPTRKVVAVSVSWTYRGRGMSESLSGAILDHDAATPPDFDNRGVVAGRININPNNSPDNQFYMERSDGYTITRDDLTDEDFPDYTGTATLVTVKPKGPGTQETLTLNGEVFDLSNANTYTFLADTMDVMIWNDHRNPHGKAVGKWWINLAGDNVTITAE